MSNRDRIHVFVGPFPNANPVVCAVLQMTAKDIEGPGRHTVSTELRPDEVEALVTKLRQARNSLRVRKIAGAEAVRPQPGANQP